MSQNNLKTLRRSLPALAIGLALALAVGPAHAFEEDPAGTTSEYQNNHDNGHQVLRIVPGAVSSALLIGDSLSTGAGKPWNVTDQEPPYGDYFAGAKWNFRMRAKSGATVRWHRETGGWTSPGWSTSTPELWGQSFQDSFQLAQKATGLNAVFVELGTNDVRCLHPYEAGRQACAWPQRHDDPATPPPSTDATRYTPWINRQHDLIKAQVEAGIKTLVDAGRCVVWMGVREIPAAKAPAANNPVDARWFNQLIVDETGKAANKNKLFYADWNAYSAQNAAVAANFADPSSDQIHLDVAAGGKGLEARKALAAFALMATAGKCPPR